MGALGEMIIQKPGGGSEISKKRRFRSFFGVCPETCVILWKLLASFVPRMAIPHHLLWALLFLKTYATEHVNATIAQVDEKTFRKWSWKFVVLLSELQIVRLLKPNVLFFGSCTSLSNIT